MDLPIPTHLQEYLTLSGQRNSEYDVSGSIRCSCGNESFEIRESNSRNIIKLTCSECRKEILLFDAGKHGWDGFVCKSDYLDRSLPFEKFICPRCNQDRFHVSVHISSQGKQDFLTECVENDESFTLDDWVDGFEWFTASVHCSDCDFQDNEWADIETM